MPWTTKLSVWNRRPERNPTRVYLYDTDPIWIIVHILTSGREAASWNDLLRDIETEKIVNFKFSGRDFKLFVPNLKIFRLGKEPQAWKNRSEQNLIKYILVLVGNSLISNEIVIEAVDLSPVILPLAGNV